MSSVHWEPLDAPGCFACTPIPAPSAQPGAPVGDAVTAPRRGKRPGRLRKALFWIHLGAGTAAGLVILMMSATGVLLTYERQILGWAERSGWPEPPPGIERLSIDELLAEARAVPGAPSYDSVSVSAAEQAPVQLRAGRRDRVWLDPWSGASMADPAGAWRDFFAEVTAWHRWFAVGDAERDTARQITGAANLVFLLLAVSGLVLWWPQAWRWPWLRGRLWFRCRYATGKARDYNWHHVLGFWCALPLIVITATASVFYYTWANDLVYRIVGDEPPCRDCGPPPGPLGQRERDRTSAEVLPPAAAGRSLQELLDAASVAAGDWRTLTLTLPQPGAATVSVRVDRGNGGQPQLTETLTLDRNSAAVVAREAFAAQAPGTRARSIVRFLHTGEVLGVAGQTLAGLASLAGALLVWTGLALAYRRLVRPLLQRRRQLAQGAR